MSFIAESEVLFQPKRSLHSYLAHTSLDRHSFLFPILQTIPDSVDGSCTSVTEGHIWGPMDKVPDTDYPVNQAPGENPQAFTFKLIF